MPARTKVRRRGREFGYPCPDRFADRVKHLIGIRIDVEVAGPHTVERSAGKMRRIVDHRTSR